MQWGLVRGTKSLMGWSLFCAATIAAASAKASSDKLPDGDFNEGIFGPAAGGPARVVTSESNCFIVRTIKPGEVEFQRQVERFRVKRSRATRPDDFYELRFTATRNGKATGLQIRPAGVIRSGKVAGPARGNPEEPVETGMIMPDEGFVVVNGTAPIVAVRRGTISSQGTKFAVEATATHWLVVAIEAVLNNDVVVYFPESGLGPIECVTSDCWKFPNDAANPQAGAQLPATDPECAALIACAELVLSFTQ